MDNVNAPIGAEPTSTPQSAEPSTPDIVELSEESMVRVPGQDKPVRYSDLFKSQNRDYTQKTQALAAERRAWEAERAKANEAVKAEQARLQSLAAELMQSRRAASGPDVLAQLEGMQQVDGRTVAAMARAFQDDGLKPIVEAIKQRDEKINLLSGQLARLNSSFQQLQGTHADREFNSRIDQVLKDVGMPASAREFAKDVYLSYEPSARLDQEFPELLKSRWETVTSAFEQARTEKAAAAKRDLMFPTKGGDATASNPLGLKGTESAREVSDALWDRLQEQQT